MILHQIPFDPGPLDTMTARLCRTMDAMNDRDRKSVV